MNDTRSCLAHAIRQVLAVLTPPKAGEFKHDNMFNQLAEECNPELTYPSDFKDDDINAVFHFANAFFFDWDEGRWRMNNGMDYDRARELLEELVVQLESGKAITNPEIRSFIWHRPPAK